MSASKEAKRNCVKMLSELDTQIGVLRDGGALNQRNNGTLPSITQVSSCKSEVATTSKNKFPLKRDPESGWHS